MPRHARSRSAYRAYRLGLRRYTLLYLRCLRSSQLVRVPCGEGQGLLVASRLQNHLVSAAAARCGMGALRDQVGLHQEQLGRLMMTMPAFRTASLRHSGSRGGGSTCCPGLARMSCRLAQGRGRHRAAGPGSGRGQVWAGVSAADCSVAGRLASWRLDTSEPGHCAASCGIVATNATRATPTTGGWADAMGEETA